MLACKTCTEGPSRCVSICPFGISILRTAGTPRQWKQAEEWLFLAEDALFLACVETDELQAGCRLRHFPHTSLRVA